MCDSLDCRAKLVHSGLRWDGCRSPCPGRVEKGFQSGCRLGALFAPCLKDLIHQGSAGSCLQQSFQTLPQCLTKLEKFVILSATRVPATATCSHDRYRCQTRHRPIFFWQDHSECVMAEPGQEWIPVWAVPVMQTVPAGDLCLWFR